VGGGEPPDNAGFHQEFSTSALFVEVGLRFRHALREYSPNARLNNVRKRASTRTLLA
jgi:hypothetical protein